MLAWALVFSSEHLGYLKVFECENEVTIVIAPVLKGNKYKVE
jgi:hypothetical protein